MEKDSTNLWIVAIVAIVAIVGLVILYMNMSKVSVTGEAVTIKPIEDRVLVQPLDTTGQAYYVRVDGQPGYITVTSPEYYAPVDGYPTSGQAYSYGGWENR